MKPNRRRAELRFLIGVHLCFVLIGATTTIVGVVLPALAARFELNDGQSNWFFVAHATGALLGTLFSARISARIKFLRTIAVGLLASAAGVAAIAAASPPIVAAAIFLNGLGVGLTIPTINLLIARLGDEQSGENAAALNLLNFSWSAGAFCSPLFFAALGDRLRINAPLFALAAALAAFAIKFARGTQFDFAARADAPAPHGSAEIGARRFWSKPQALLALLFFFVYLGAENGLSGWLASFALREQIDATTSTLR